MRIATTDDADAFAETVRQGFESFREWAAPGFHPPPPSGEAQRIREGLAPPTTWATIATDDGRVAGHVAFRQARERDEPQRDIPGRAHLWQLFVRRDWWGCGVASRLNALAVEEARRRGFEAMQLLTPFDHVRARAFYAREGWSTDDVPVPEPLLGIDLVMYRRALR